VPGTQNNFRLTGRAVLNEELNDMDWWYSVGYCPHFSAGGYLFMVMLQGDFTYC